MKISVKREQLDREERVERKLLLAEHTQKWEARRHALRMECAATDHTDGGQRGDQSSSPWICWHCGAQLAERPFYADVLGFG